MKTLDSFFLSYRGVKEEMGVGGGRDLCKWNRRNMPLT